MVLMITAGFLLVVGLVLAVVWGGERFVAVPDPFKPVAPLSPPRHPHLAGLRFALWWAAILTVTGTTTGILVVGAGGRLAMRLLAVTSPDARARLTEAGALVGFITPEGTLGYVAFGALPLAFASTALYLLVAPWLPPGRLAGPAFGMLLLITLSAFLEPLRPGNIDFDAVGPGWLSVLLFSALAVLQGATLAAVAGRLSRSLPLMTRRTWPATAAALAPAVVLFPLGIVLAVGALISLALPRLLPWMLAARASRGGILAGRVLLIVAVLATLPAFIVAVVSIVSR